MSNTACPEPTYITTDKYQQFLGQEKLMGSKCNACGQIDLPPRRLCSKCQKETTWIELNGKGVLSTFTVIYVGNKMMTAKGYDKNKPYIFAIAKLTDGPMISGQLIGVDETKPDLIKLGLSLKVIFLKTEIGKDKENKPVFRTDIGFQAI
jgi:uncharacterized OB-fold protein